MAGEHQISGLSGYPHSNDRAYDIDTGDYTGRITEYNCELTGFDPRFAEIDREIFHYGGNAYYITGVYAQRKGWTVREVERAR